MTWPLMAPPPRKRPRPRRVAPWWVNVRWRMWAVLTWPYDRRQYRRDGWRKRDGRWERLPAAEQGKERQ